MEGYGFKNEFVNVILKGKGESVIEKERESEPCELMMASYMDMDTRSLVDGVWDDIRDEEA
ncbi:PQQ-like domain-containing protein [Sesbania bispinosa]|nr:PQQ-like domain-containing protein [Sesbania bispinosa]